MRDALDDIPLVRQQHPSLSRAAPFEWLYDHHPKRSARYVGDVHRALQLTIVMAGRAEAVFHDGTHRYAPGELWWTDAFEPHACRPLADGTFLLSLNIWPEALGECGPFASGAFRSLFRGPSGARYRPRTARARRRVRLLMARLFGLYRRRPPEWRGRSWLALHAFFLEASAASGAAGGADAGDDRLARVRPALDLLREAEDGARPPPALAEAAAACAASVGRFSVHFRRATGMTFGRYALRRRLAAGARDVASGRYPLKEIARRHGFCDASGFCNAFKRVYRCRPSQFKPSAEAD